MENTTITLKLDLTPEQYAVLWRHDGMFPARLKAHLQEKVSDMLVGAFHKLKCNMEDGESADFARRILESAPKEKETPPSEEHP